MEYGVSRAVQHALSRIADALEKQNELLTKIVKKMEQEEQNND